MKIAIVGAHGSGKTTLSLGLVMNLKIMGRNAELMTEVARHSPYLIAGQQSPEAQLHIFSSQVESELRHARTCDVLVTDRCVLDHLMYLELFFPESKDFIQAERDFSRVYIKTYDHIFRTSTIYNSEEIKDNLRPKDLSLQRKAHENLGKLLEEFYPDYISLPSAKDVNAITFIMEHI